MTDLGVRTSVPVLGENWGKATANDLSSFRRHGLAEFLVQLSQSFVCHNEISADGKITLRNQPLQKLDTYIQ